MFCLALGILMVSGSYGLGRSSHGVWGAFRRAVVRALLILGLFLLGARRIRS